MDTFLFHHNTYSLIFKMKQKEYEKCFGNFFFCIKIKSWKITLHSLQPSTFFNLLKTIKLLRNIRRNNQNVRLSVNNFYRSIKDFWRNILLQLTKNLQVLTTIQNTYASYLSVHHETYFKIHITRLL